MFVYRTVVFYRKPLFLFGSEGFHQRPILSMMSHIFIRTFGFVIRKYLLTQFAGINKCEN